MNDMMHIIHSSYDNNYAVGLDYRAVQKKRLPHSNLRHNCGKFRRCGGKYNKDHAANLLQSPTVEEILKLVNICRRCLQD